MLAISRLNEGFIGALQEHFINPDEEVISKGGLFFLALDAFNRRVSFCNRTNTLSKICLVAAAVFAYYFSGVGVVACILGAGLFHKIHSVAREKLTSEHPFLQALIKSQVLVWMKDGTYVYLKLDKKYTPDSSMGFKRSLHSKNLMLVSKGGVVP